jgi:hypothetical protein
VARLSGLDEVRQDRATRGDVGVVYRPIRETVKECVSSIERNAATKRANRWFWSQIVRERHEFVLTAARTMEQHHRLGIGIGTGLKRCDIAVSGIREDPFTRRVAARFSLIAPAVIQLAGFGSGVFGFSVVRGKEIFDHFKAGCRLLDMRHVAGLRENRPTRVGDAICEGLDYRFGGLIVAARNQQGGGLNTVKPIDD